MNSRQKEPAPVPASSPDPKIILLEGMPPAAPAPRPRRRAHGQVLVLLAVLWTLLLVATIVERNAELRPILGLLGFVFIVYAVYATFSTALAGRADAARPDPGDRPRGPR